MNQRTDFPVDMVYTWVDGGRADYQRQLRSYTTNPENLNPERVRDHYGLIRYSLRSVAMYADWVRRIFIVTCRPQVPDWLNTDDPRIRVVHHDEIFEDAGCLPTFNHCAIETHLHRIPGLSERFVYMNDDFLFGRPTPAADFFTPGGRVKVFGTFAGENLGFRIYQSRHDIVSFGFMEHTPYPFIKRYMGDMLAEKPEAVARTRRNRFRQAGDLSINKLFRWYMLKHRRAKTAVVPAWSLLRCHRFHKITNHPARQRRALGRLSRLRPKFYCLNDDQRDNPSEAVSRIWRAFLARTYPNPSPFEKPAPAGAEEPM